MGQHEQGMAQAAVHAVPSTRPAPIAGAAGFEDFYRSNYRKLLAMTMAAGATLDQAEEAVDQTMEQMLTRWTEIGHPVAYARRAVLSNFVKKKTRDLEAVNKVIKSGRVTPEADPDTGLNVWEDTQWVGQLLQSLPPAQRDVMTNIIKGLTTAEIAQLLGKTEAAVRKNLQLARDRLKLLLRREREREQEAQEAPNASKTRTEEVR